jgi:hypothetical protein
MENKLDLSYSKKEELANALMNDYIKMTYTVTASYAQVAMQNPNGWSNICSKDDNSYVESGTNTGKTLILTIDDASTLELIQQNGLLFRGKYITITSIELVKPDNRFDAVPLTIGSDGVATYGSSKSLDFTSLAGKVTPYYVSATAQGSVTLTSVPITRGWAGYIVQGTAGTYDVPVAASEPDWMDAFNNLRYSGDYDGNWVYRSAYSGYSGGGDNATKIRTYYRYIFAKKDANIGFYKLATDYERVTTEKEGDNEAGTTVYYHILNAHKAYLETETDITPGQNARIALIFDDDMPTAISTIEQKAATDNVYYNLSGQRIEHPTKGLYIVNGKKVIIK